VAGAVVIVVVLVIAVPVAFLMVAGALTVLMGWLVQSYGEASHPGSELTDLNR